MSWKFERDNGVGGEKGHSLFMARIGSMFGPRRVQQRSLGSYNPDRDGFLQRHPLFRQTVDDYGEDDPSPRPTAHFTSVPVRNFMPSSETGLAPDPHVLWRPEV